MTESLTSTTSCLTSESTGSPAWYADKTSGLLRTAECWPSQSRVDGGVFFRKAENLAFAEHAPLERFLDHPEIFDSRLSSRKDARDFAKQCGSRTFTLNSLVRLRCGPQEASLATKLGADEANYHYTDYDASLRNAERQSRMASALTELSRRLSNLNRRDLRETASTLAADGLLQPASNLFRIDRSIWDVWPVPLSEEVAQDFLIGDRGEELAYRSELERVRSFGYETPERYVIWTSRSDAGADHDIRSVTDGGGLLWIEVKSSTGTDGWIYWPKREFEKARRERERYELWRVYESHTTHPMAKCFRDPISLLNRNALRLELGTLRAIIEPLENKS